MSDLILKLGTKVEFLCPEPEILSMFDQLHNGSLHVVMTQKNAVTLN
jgi:hypothetical protein